MPGMTQGGSVVAQTVQRGDNLDIGPAPVGGYPTGHVLPVAGFVGVINVGVKEGRMAAASIKGVYAIMNSGITPTAGTKVDINYTTQTIVAAAAGDQAAGTVIEDVASATDRVKVLINEVPAA